MAQTGFTPLLIYSSSTATNAPTSGNLLNNATGSELAINIADGKLFYKDSSGSVQVIAWKTTPTTAGGTGLTNYTAGDLPYYASGSAFTKLGIGTSGYFLTSSGSAPQWTDPTTLAVTSISFGTTGLTPSTATKGAVTVAGTLSANNGGTGESGTLTGILYGNGASPFTVATSSQISTSASQNMPTCNYYQSSPQTLVANTATKITLTSNIWDTTSGMFSSSRFTPTIGGYYQVNAAFQVSAAFTGGGAYIYKNGSVYSYGPATSSASVISGTFTVSCLVYLNGSTDYIEFYGLIGIGQALSASAATTFMQIAMVRTT